jgi:hypothetical protein
MILRYFFISTIPNEYHNNFSTGGRSYWCLTHEEEEEGEEEEEEEEEGEKGE